MTQIEFEDSVYEKEGFYVGFSNDGQKLKKSPRLRNPETKEVECADEKCEEMTRSKYGVCTEHYDKKHPEHSVDWIAKFVPPEYDEGEVHFIIATHKYLTEKLWAWAEEDEEKIKKLDEFILEDIMKNVPEKIPDSTTLQSSLEDEKSEFKSPSDVIEMVNDSVDEHFPESEYEGVFLPGGSKIVNRNDEDWKTMEYEWDKIPIRAAASLYYLANICEEANRGDAWYKKNILDDEEPDKAGSYMSLGFYIYRRYTGANINQIDKTINPPY